MILYIYPHTRLTKQASSTLLWRLGTMDVHINVRWIQLETLTFREQVLRATETDVLMGVRGNGLSYCLFSRRPGMQMYMYMYMCICIYVYVYKYIYIGVHGNGLSYYDFSVGPVYMYVYVLCICISIFLFEYA